MAIEGPLLLVGCGKMGGTLLRGWLARGLAADRLAVVDPHPPAAVAEELGVSCHEACPEGLRPKVVVFAVKPQLMATVVPRYRDLVRPETVFLSIAAGTPVGFFERQLGAEAAIVRAMPNTPAAVGRGISVLLANARVGGEQRALCETLMSAVGEVAWVADEALLDPVTAVSGSGPAYLFLLVEALAEAGTAAGLPPELSMRLARATLAGAGALLHESAESAETLRRQVTSPGGTTEAALGVLMGEGGLQDVMTRAVAAATRRSIELKS